MIRVTVSYPTTADASFDHGYYETKHRALVQSLMGPHGLVRVEMDRYLSDGRASQPRSWLRHTCCLPTWRVFRPPWPLSVKP
ncbi:MAG: EthD family reductase [Sulfuritalea sp.]|nr:EthD family reductase [Sulfuritalea sp.]